MNVVERLLPVFDAYQEAYERIRAGEPGPFEIADATLAQDIEDGAALRLLREALPKAWTVYLTDCSSDVHIRVWDTTRTQISHHAPTIAAAADACRAALEAA